MKNLLIFTTFLLLIPIIASVHEGLKENLIKIFPIHQKPNSLRSCTGIALNEKFFITTQICAAQTIHGHSARVLHQKNDKITCDITPNKRFTVGWNNNIVVGKFKQPLKGIKKITISGSATVYPGTFFELIGYKNYNNTETFNLQVKIQPSKICESTKFEANTHFKFHEETQICGTFFLENLSNLHFGSILVDKTHNNIVGVLSVFTKIPYMNVATVLAVFTKLSSYCDFITSHSNLSYICS